MKINANAVFYHQSHADRRTTCRQCRRRRLTRIVWLDVEVEYRGHTQWVAVDAGDLCATCRGELGEELKAP